MSHLSKIELEVRDLQTLSKACERMGMNLIQNKSHFKWFAREDGKCDHAISIPGAEYEIGVIKKDSHYELSCDFYDRRLSERIGEGGGRLKQAYAIEKTKQAARIKGYSVTERQNKGQVQLRIAIP